VTAKHGTKEGYELGCRGSQCEAPVSCTQARIRYSGDYQYMKRVDAGMTPAEIASAELADVADARAAKAEAVRAARPAKVKRAPTGLRRPKKPKPPKIAKEPKPPKVKYEPAHGTNARYRRGCTIDKDCPNKTVISCRRANYEYGRTYDQNRLNGVGTPVIHGRESGVQYGCRKVEACPEHAAGRISCREAQRVEATRRRAEKKALNTPATNLKADAA